MPNKLKDGIVIPKSPKKRVTMIKNRVGKVKTSSYCLPDDDFVYGIPSKIDKEGAGQVMQSWTQSSPSKPQTTTQSFPATNRKALKNGHLTAKSQRNFAKNDPVPKRNPKCKKDNSTTSSSHDNSRSFGIESLANDVPIDQLLKIAYDFEERDYPDLSHKQKKGRLPPAKSTKSSRLLREVIRAPCAEILREKKVKEEFKMKKFLKVESKVKVMFG